MTNPKVRAGSSAIPGAECALPIANDMSLPHAETDGKQPRDSPRAVDAIIAVVKVNDPPLRLLLGLACVDRIYNSLAAASKELDCWSEVSLVTSFEPADTVANPMR